MLGKYAYGTNIACLDCGSGLFSTQPGSVQCSVCPLGTSSQKNGTVSCGPCAVGTALGGGNHTCTPCQAGLFARVTGSETCSPCPSGFVMVVWCHRYPTIGYLFCRMVQLHRITVSTLIVVRLVHLNRL